MSLNTLVAFVCGFTLAVVLACMTGCTAPVSPHKPATGPHHAGPNAWNLQDSEKRQAFCYAEVLKLVKKNHVTDADMPVVKAVWFDCMNQNGGVM